MTTECPELFDHVETTSERIGSCLQRFVRAFGGGKFNGAWRGVTELRPCGHHEIGWMLKEHYLGCWPGVVTAKLAVSVEGILAGAIVYALPPAETSKRYGGETWELARLWVHDSVPRNIETWTIAKSVKWIKRHRPEVKFLVSYADPAAGHCGTIYKAANWKSDGRTDQERKTPRIDYRDAKTGQVYSRRGHVPPRAIVERVPRSSKFRFVLALCDCPNVEA